MPTTESDLIRSLKNCSLLHPYLEKLEEAISLSALVLTVLCLVRFLAVTIIEDELNRRARKAEQWPLCPVCSSRLHSKGFRSRKMLTLVGQIEWKRRLGRCPKGCKGSPHTPFDEVLGIEPHQKVSNELKKVSCAQAVFVPFDVAANLLSMLTGIPVSPSSVWHWVQEAGDKAMKKLDDELEKLAQGENPAPENLENTIGALPLIMGADGVMAPFRPQDGSPKGKADWREVKVAIFARFGKRINKKGEEVSCLKQRRLTAVLGDKDMLGSRMQLESVRQGVNSAKTVAWLSDGGRGFWSIFKKHFAQSSIGILDFYHAAQNLWKGAQACLDGSSAEAKKWFNSTRHCLRHGQNDAVLLDIENALTIKDLPESARNALSNLFTYLHDHREHIDYAKFKEMGLPIGSGLVESACKWLIQQRFKGVGMRWGEDGFNHLLHLRLAWVNSRFDDLFADASPNC